MLISRSSRLAFLTIVTTIAFASTAAAAQRYASPIGSGYACTSANPCDLDTAVFLASNADDVTVTPGDYVLSHTVEDSAPITIHGVPGNPRPRLALFGPFQKGVTLSHGSTLRDVEIDQTYAGHPALTTSYAASTGCS